MAVVAMAVDVMCIFCHELVKFNTMSTVNWYVIYMYVGCLNSSEFICLVMKWEATLRRIYSCCNFGSTLNTVYIHSLHFHLSYLLVLMQEQSSESNSLPGW